MSLEKKNDTVPLFSGYTDVYYFNRDSDKFIVINQGGSSSSKTYSIMQLICKMAIEQRLTIHVVGQDAPNLYIGPVADLKMLIADSEILRACLRNPNLDKGPFKFKNGSTIKFISAQTAQDAKSGKRDVLFINEANGIPYDIAFELIARTKLKVFIDFNPNARFWVHHELVGQNDVELIISNFTHNQFLSEKIKDQIFSWKRKYELTGSTYWKNKWMVYGLGKTGSVEGVVFDDINYTNFFPLAAKHVTYGLDFGFKNNHTALVKLGYYNKAMYGKEILYEQKLNSFQLAERLLAIGITKNDKIIADPANDEAITILQSKGFNIVPAKKGADSIKAGIELIQAIPLFITNDSHNWQQEAENYKYKKDTNGKFTNTPIDDYNDCFIAGTQVLTIDGPKAIETIEVGEQVLTSEGYNTVVHTWDNGVREVSEYKLIFEDREIVVTCTDKHKIKTTAGWKQIQDLQEQDILYLCNTSTEEDLVCTQKLNTFLGINYLCTESFGNITMGQYRKDTMFTILMGILTIMTSVTLHWLKQVNTYLTTPKKVLKDILIGFKRQAQKQLKFGIEAKKAENGTPNMQNNKVLGTWTSVQKFVQYVLKNMQQINSTTVSVQTVANQKPDEIPGLIMKHEYADVVRNIPAINTANSQDVQKAALISIQRISKGSQPTYDLMVENCHEYFVDNLLVSNCWDACRYVYVDLFGVRLKKAEKKGRQKFVRKVSVV